MAFRIDDQRMLQDLRRLAQFGKAGEGVNRRALSAADMDSRRWLVERMRDAGLEASIDGAGNVVGRTAHKRHVLIGSHTDTVPEGGWLDGALGVIYGLELARAFAPESGEIGIEVISFNDEEGHFLPFLGSKLFCGDVSLAEVSARQNSAGERLDDVLAACGLGDRPLQRLDAARHVAFLEAHIEQGPVLESRRMQTGIVNGIVGVCEKRVTFHGEANHAGTVPMDMRRDAGAAMLAFGESIGRECRALHHAGTVWNLGRFESDPDAGNVVPRRASCTFQYRSPDAAILDHIDSLADDLAMKAAEQFGAHYDIVKIFAQPPVAMSATLTMEIERAAEDVGALAMRMPSGAGHDAMIVGAHIPAGMLFIPSEGGISHNTVENTAEHDLRRGLHVFARSVERILARLNAS